MKTELRHMLAAITAIATMAATSYANAKPLKVYILAGQSNMQGKAKTSTFPHMAMDKEAKPLLDKIIDENSKPRVYKDVHVAAFSAAGGNNTTKFGPLTVGFGSGLTEPSATDFLLRLNSKASI